MRGSEARLVEHAMLGWYTPLSMAKLGTCSHQRHRPLFAESIIVEEKVWNWVVANISLMAFGTSAPEILLS